MAAVLKETGDFIGNAGVHHKPENDWGADLDFEITPEHWRHGHATEATAALIEYCFNDMKRHRISASCVAKNRASSRVLLKLGTHEEGRLRKNKFFKGRWWDTRIFGYLKDEWTGLA